MGSRVTLIGSNEPHAIFFHQCEALLVIGADDLGVANNGGINTSMGTQQCCFPEFIEHAERVVNQVSSSCGIHAE